MQAAIATWQTFRSRHPALDRIVANLGWWFVDRALSLLLAFAVSIHVARYLGPAQLGLLASGLAVIEIMHAVAGLNLGPIVVGQLAKHPRRADRILGSASLLIAGSSAVAIAIILIIAWTGALDRQISWILTMLCFNYCLTPLHDTQSYYFQQRLEEKSNVIAKNSALGLSALLRVILIFAGAPLFWFVLVFNIDAATRTTVRHFLFKRAGQTIRTWRPTKPMVTLFLKTAAPLAVALLASALYRRLDIVMLHAITGPERAGIYSAGIRVFELFFFIPAALGASLLPSLINARKQNRVVYESRLQSYFKLSALLGYGVAVVTSLVAAPVIDFIYGDAFKATAAVVTINMWAFIPFCLGWARQELLTAENLLKLVLPCAIAGAVVNFTLNFLFIPIWYELGAAYATLVSAFVAHIAISFCLGQRGREIGWLQLEAMANPIPNFSNLSNRA